jgi:hypothetical protein
MIFQVLIAFLNHGTISQMWVSESLGPDDAVKLEEEVTQQLARVLLVVNIYIKAKENANIETVMWHLFTAAGEERFLSW